MALRKSLILRKLRSNCLEGRTVLIQLDLNSFTCSPLRRGGWDHPSRARARSKSDQEQALDVIQFRVRKTGGNRPAEAYR